MKNYEVYEFTEVSTNHLIYEFTSIGPEGFIKKVIEFQKIEAKIFNLSFGNRKLDGTIDDLATNDNRDRNKVLATVAFAIIQFTQRYPDRSICLFGSTTSRTRLYRMAISLHYGELSKIFEIYGFSENLEMNTFDPTQLYIGFLVKRK